MSHALPRLARAGLLLAAGVCCVSPFAQAQNGRGEESYRVAMGLLRRGLHDDAAEQLRQFLQSNAEHRLAPEAYYRLGVCLQELGRGEAAIDAFESALERPEALELLPECRYRLANALKQLERFDEAAGYYRALAADVAEDHYLRVPALYARGECLRDEDKTEAALTAFLAAAEAARTDDGSHGMPALYQAGFAQMRLERFADASRTFAAAAERYPNHEVATECRYLEGDAAFRAGDTQGARRGYGRARAAGGPFADDAVMGLGWCELQDGHETEALARFREVVGGHGSSPHAPQARLEVGRILFREGQLDQAIAELAAIVAEGTEPAVRVGALELQGLALLDKAQAKQAVERFRTAVEVAVDEPTRARLYYEIGEGLAELGQWQQALASYQQAAPRATDPALVGDVLYGEGLALHKLGRFEPALERVRTLIDSQPEHRLAIEARFAAAENLFAAKRYGEADVAYTKIPTGHALADQAAFKRAWCAFLGGDLKTAAKRFGAVAEASDGAPALAEESLSMVALASFNAGDLDGALQAADRYRGRHPDGVFLARTERVAARVLRQRGELQAAASRLAAAAKAEGSESQAAEDLLEQAELMFQRGDFEAAAERYGGLVDREGAVGARAIEGLAWCAFELGDDQLCLERADAALAHADVGARRVGILELMLAALHRAERWDDAAATARGFLEEYPDHPRAVEVGFGLGIAHARSGRHGEARALFAKLVSEGDISGPDRLYYEWAWACRRDGDEKAALAAFAKVAELSDDPERAGEANLHLGLAALEGGEAQTGRNYLANVKGEHRAQAQYRIGFSWLEEERPDQALNSFQAVVDLGPTQPLYHEALFLAAESELRMEQHEPAAKRYGALLEQVPDHDRSQLARLHGGRCLVLTSRAADAAATLEDYVQRGGGTKAEQAEAQLWLGRARAARKEYDRAEVAFTKATQLSEGELAAEAQYRLGEMYRERGDVAGAAKAFAVLAILYGHEQWVAKGLLQVGLCFEELQQPAKATKFFRELIEKYPKSAESEQARARLLKLEGR